MILAEISDLEPVADGKVLTREHINQHQAKLASIIVSFINKQDLKYFSNSLKTEDSTADSLLEVKEANTLRSNLEQRGKHEQNDKLIGTLNKKKKNQSLVKAMSRKKHYKQRKIRKRRRNDNY